MPRTALVVELYKDRINTGSDHGRVIRKLINSDLFADKMAILSNNPIPPSVKGFTRPEDLTRSSRTRTQAVPDRWSVCEALTSA